MLSTRWIASVQTKNKNAMLKNSLALAELAFWILLHRKLKKQKSIAKPTIRIVIAPHENKSEIQENHFFPLLKQQCHKRPWNAIGINYV